MGPSPAEFRQRELVARVKTPVAGCRKIAFISRKGGVGKTSTCLLVGHTFATYRGDRVIAVDGNPDAGTLGHRVRRETTRDDRLAARRPEAIERYADIRGYTSQAPSRLEVVAADDDPRITQRIGEHEFHRRDRASRAPLQPRLPRHRHRRSRIRRPGASSTPPIRSSSSARRASTELAPQAPPSTGWTRTGTTNSSGNPSPCSTRSAASGRRSTSTGSRSTSPRGAAPASASPGIRISRPAPKAHSTTCSPTPAGPTSNSPPRSPPASPKHRKEAITMILVSTLLAATGIGGTPDPNGLPGSFCASVADLRHRLLGAARRARRAAHLGRRLGALVPLRQLPTRLRGPPRNSHLGRRRVPRRRRPRDHQLLREPRPNGQVTCPAATSAGTTRNADEARFAACSRLARRRRSCCSGSASRSAAASPRATQTAPPTANRDRHQSATPSVSDGDAVADCEARAHSRAAPPRRPPVDHRIRRERPARPATAPQRSSNGSPRQARAADLVTRSSRRARRRASKLGAGTAPRAGHRAPAVPVGYRVEPYSPTSATVAVWYVGIVGSGATVSRSSRGAPRSSHSSGRTTPGR